MSEKFRTAVVIFRFIGNGEGTEWAANLDEDTTDAHAVA